MNKLLMTVLLLAAPCAAAQTIPAVPPGQMPSVAPVAAPVQTTADQTVPATFKLSAPVGSTLELTSTTTTRMSISDVQVAAAPGSKVSAAKLNEIRRSMTAGLNKASSLQAMTFSGKTFVKVAGRDAAGNTTLIATTSQNLPKAPGASRAGPQTITMKVTEVISPEGKLTNLKVESDNSQLTAMFKSLSADKLNSVVEQQGGTFTGVYGAPLVPGMPQTKTTKVDAQSLLSGLLTSVAGPQGQQMFGQVQATPMTATVTTTYKGTDAQGRHIFATRSAYNPWQVSLQAAAGSKTPMQMKLQLADMKSGGTTLYRADGLPSSMQQSSDMNMKVTMIVEGIQISMTMTMNQQMTMQAR
ncbi:hypothetical protein [Deinococcus sp.]|uniref:hypothetical protein n=1 Tax=Deinococcus sp. TaxID=47478 RepID=UPI0025C6F791|nr:hypothetical protein [Deinococcus sp.]